jgi:hypothetical protein
MTFVTSIADAGFELVTGYVSGNRAQACRQVRADIRGFLQPFVLLSGTLKIIGSRCSMAQRPSGSIGQTIRPAPTGRRDPS